MLDQARIHRFATSYGERQPPQFVMAATLAAELGHIIRHARRLSLSAKNARVITVRAGEWGRGFSGITQFIDEYARRTIQGAENIHRTSRQLSRRSVKGLFCSSLNVRLGRVRARHPRFEEGLTCCQTRLGDENDLYERDRLAAYQALRRDIDEIRACSRALSSLVAICRIEASRAGPFQEALSVIATEIEHATGELMQSINAGKSLLAYMNHD